MDVQGHLQTIQGHPVPPLLTPDVDLCSPPALFFIDFTQGCNDGLADTKIQVINQNHQLTYLGLQTLTLLHGRVYGLLDVAICRAIKVGHLPIA